MPDSWWRHRLVAVTVAVATLAAAESWLLFGKRSGEVGYAPPAAETAPSLEVFGTTELTQSFTPGAGGLAAITVYPRRAAATPPGPAVISLYGDDPARPLAQTTAPAAALAAAGEWTWTLPALPPAPSRVFTVRIAVPEATRGEGLTLATGPPGYASGELFIGGRAQWGDLKFQTRAVRWRLIDHWRGDDTSRLPTRASVLTVLAVLTLALAVLSAGLAVPD